MNEGRRQKTEWALILGASSGFGEAAALERAGCGMNILGVHLDRKSTWEMWSALPEITSRGPKRFSLMSMPRIQKSELSLGSSVSFQAKVRACAIGCSPFSGLWDPQAISSRTAKRDASKRQWIDAGRHGRISVYCTQDLVRRRLMALAVVCSHDERRGARVWKTYGAVSAAKSALDLMSGS